MKRRNKLIFMLLLGIMIGAGALLLVSDDALAWKCSGALQCGTIVATTNLVESSRCTQNSSDVLLTWNAFNPSTIVDKNDVPILQGAEVNNYEVWRCQGIQCKPLEGGKIASLPPSQTSYTDPGLSPLTVYRYKIVALVSSENKGTFSFPSKGRTATTCSVSCSGPTPSVTLGTLRAGFDTTADTALDITGPNNFSTILTNTLVNTLYTVTWNDAISTSDYNYTFTYLNPSAGNKKQDSGSFTTPNCAPPPTANISADSASVPYNTGTTVRWSSSNATSCSVSPIGWTGTSGAQGTGNLTSAQTYTLNCSGPGGSSPPASVTVNVGGPPSVSISADSTNIPYNTGTTVRWSSANVTGCTVSPDGWTGSSGAQSTGNLTANKTYTANCTAPGDPPPPASVTVNVGGPPQPTSDIKANGSDGSISVAYNTSATISWTSANATSCSVSPTGWTGTSNSGISTGNLTSNQTYTLNCSGPGGNAPPDSVTVNTGAAPQPDYVTDGLAISPGNLTAGQSVTFAATVRNSGSGAASVSSQTRLRLDIGNNGTFDLTPANQTTTARPVGATEVENWTNAWTATAGTHLFEVCADSGTAISESSETNNCTTQTFTVTGPPLTASCAVSPTSAQINELVTWLATPSGGGGPGTYSFLWSGSPPLAGKTSNPAVVPYSTLCEKTGAVTVTSGAQNTGQIACDNTVTISSALVSASPSAIRKTENSTLTWSAPGFDSCGITDNFGTVIKPSNSPNSGSVGVTPLVTTTYTLSCVKDAGAECSAPITGTDSTTITVAGVPRFREIPPQ